jgi:hypothetical protein
MFANVSQVLNVLLINSDSLSNSQHVTDTESITNVNFIQKRCIVVVLYTTNHFLVERKMYAALSGDVRQLVAAANRINIVYVVIL